MISKNLFFYVIIAIAIVAVAYFVMSGNIHKVYSVNTQLYSSNTSNLYPYNTTHFLILVNNTGTTAISGMLIGFYINGAASHMYNVSIPIHKTADIYINYTYPLKQVLLKPI